MGNRIVDTGKLTVGVYASLTVWWVSFFFFFFRLDGLIFRAGEGPVCPPGPLKPHPSRVFIFPALSECHTPAFVTFLDLRLFLQLWLKILSWLLLLIHYWREDFQVWSTVHTAQDSIRQHAKDYMELVKGGCDSGQKQVSTDHISM